MLCSFFLQFFFFNLRFVGLDDNTFFFKIVFCFFLFVIFIGYIGGLVALE